MAHSLYNTPFVSSPQEDVPREGCGPLSGVCLQGRSHREARVLPGEMRSVPDQQERPREQKAGMRGRGRRKHGPGTDTEDERKGRRERVIGKEEYIVHFEIGQGFDHFSTIAKEICEFWSEYHFSVSRTIFCTTASGCTTPERTTATRLQY